MVTSAPSGHMICNLTGPLTEPRPKCATGCTMNQHNFVKINQRPKTKDQNFRRLTAVQCNSVLFISVNWIIYLSGECFWRNFQWNDSKFKISEPPPSYWDKDFYLHRTQVAAVHVIGHITTTSQAHQYSWNRENISYIDSLHFQDTTRATEVSFKGCKAAPRFN